MSAEVIPETPMPVQVPVPEPEVIDTPTMENPNKFVPKLKLKTLHEQKVELGKRAYRDVVEDEIMDEKVMKMLNKTSDFVYADDSEYYQFYERKKLNEDSWRDLYKSDDKAYKALKSKFLLTEEKKKNEIILERGLEFKPIESDALGKTNQLQANEINLRDSNTNNMGMNANFKLNINNKKDKEDAALERHKNRICDYSDDSASEHGSESDDTQCQKVIERKKSEQNSESSQD